MKRYACLFGRSGTKGRHISSCIIITMAVEIVKMMKREKVMTTHEDSGDVDDEEF